jgi:hypothetical protein
VGWGVASALAARSVRASVLAGGAVFVAYGLAVARSFATLER